jgi:hypothetical protein
MAGQALELLLLLAGQSEGEAVRHGRLVSTVLTGSCPGLGERGVKTA